MTSSDSTISQRINRERRARARSLQRNTMGDNAALATAIQALAEAIARMQARPSTTTATAIFDPFAEDTPFDLSSRAGVQAFSEACAKLDNEWDGSVHTFPSFLVSLRLRANEAKWDAPNPHGILEIGGKDILHEYHSISETDITTAQVARTDNRAIQNTKAMFQCIKSSITGGVRDTIFAQSGNIPKVRDGIALFKKLTSFTSIASMQLSNMSLTAILEFNPLELKFNIPKINTKLSELFVLATTQTRKLDDQERIQHTLNTYSKILQPEIWAQWVRNHVNSFEEGKITVCQDLMNTATIKYNKICNINDGQFKGSVHSVQEDVLALFATKRLKSKRKREDEDNDGDQVKKVYKREVPDFTTHTKDAATGKPYKIGDSKMFNGKTFHFCDAPTHRDKSKWHTHKADDCWVRKRWLKKESEKRRKQLR